MKKYKCVIFDCDGVLVDSEPLANGMLVEMANELGANIDLDFAYKNFKGNSFQSCQKIIKSIAKVPLEENFETEYRRRSFEVFSKFIKPIQGVESVLKSLTIPYCVASSGPQDKIKLNLQKTGLLPYFENNIFSCYDVQRWKPEPHVFLHAASTMGFTVEDCVIIEDTPIGVKAAKSGGFDVFGFADEYTHELFEKETTKVFTHMNELKGILNQSF
ncbi:HAD family hydrolase [Urechidicola croceus]|uniref:HAD family hydrolase n=1 Tax=Urechidicola croceus TaxID=1850246 RepID=A0A1D8P6V6_9FLAO|nr:HAD family hydrolase [Urechidicola croceus]AOW20299.1 HAD family hydrolase [Urechidicola croceus]